MCGGLYICISSVQRNIKCSALAMQLPYLHHQCMLGTRCALTLWATKEMGVVHDMHAFVLDKGDCQLFVREC